MCVQKCQAVVDEVAAAVHLGLWRGAEMVDRMVK